jgi:hypothetical protein
MTGPAVDRKQHELVETERREDDERLLKDRLGADTLVLAHGDISDECQCQRVFAEHRALEDIEHQTGEEPESDAAGAWRIHRPIEHGEYQERRPQHIEPRRQRQHREYQRHESSEEHAAAGIDVHGCGSLGAGVSAGGEASGDAAAGGPGGAASGPAEGAVAAGCGAGGGFVAAGVAAGCEAGVCVAAAGAAPGGARGSRAAGVEGGAADLAACGCSATLPDLSSPSEGPICDGAAG